MIKSSHIIYALIIIIVLAAIVFICTSIALGEEEKITENDSNITQKRNIRNTCIASLLISLLIAGISVFLIISIKNGVGSQLKNEVSSLENEKNGSQILEDFERSKNDASSQAGPSLSRSANVRYYRWSDYGKRWPKSLYKSWKDDESYKFSPDLSVRRGSAGSDESHVRQQNLSSPDDYMVHPPRIIVTPDVGILSQRNHQPSITPDFSVHMTSPRSQSSRGSNIPNFRNQPLTGNPSRVNSNSKEYLQRINLLRKKDFEEEKKYLPPHEDKFENPPDF